MQASLGHFLRQLRCARNLSQSQAARAASIGRVTLNRWESGARQPHKDDLESLLSYYSATTQEHQQALLLLRTSRGRPQNQIAIVQASAQSEVGPLPHTGAFLRALRLRCGLSQEETAKRVGVAERTVRRWEQSEVWPSSTQLQNLCYSLGARPDEMVALTTGPLSSGLQRAVEPSVSLLELETQARALFFNNTYGQGEALKDLSFFLLEVQVWPFAVRSDAGRRVLSLLYGLHAGYLSWYERWSESGLYANRSIDLLSSTAKPDRIRVMAAIVAARSAVYRGASPTPKRGLEVLKHWVDLAEWSEYKAWLLSDMAQYMALSGETEAALLLAHRAQEMVAHCENPFELYHRKLNQAQIFIMAGKPNDALMVTEDTNRLPGQSRLAQSEAFLKLDDLTMADDRLQDALQIIENRKLIHLLPQAQRLAMRLATAAV